MDRDASPAPTADLAQITNPRPTTIPEVIAIMQRLDSALPSQDGLKWFNLLYLMVTEAIEQSPPASGWSNPQWLTRLDIVFANLYFDAIVSWQQNAGRAPRAWKALFEARYRPGVERVQFALAGMNAHINHDLPIAVVQTCAELQLLPDRPSAEYNDYEQVNSTLSAVEPQALQHLATGLVGEIAEDLGAVGHVMAMWSVEHARDTAWTNAQILWQLQNLPLARNRFLLALDRMTGFAGRGLVLPIV